MAQYINFKRKIQLGVVIPCGITQQDKKPFQFSTMKKMNSILSKTSTLSQSWGGEGSSETANATGETEIQILVLHSTCWSLIFLESFFFPPQLDEICHRVQKLWKWSKRQAGDAIAATLFSWQINLNPLMTGEMMPQPISWWPLTFQGRCH